MAHGCHPKVSRVFLEAALLSSPTPQPSLPLCSSGFAYRCPRLVQLRGWGWSQWPCWEASSTGAQVVGQWPLRKWVLFPRCQLELQPGPVLWREVGSGVEGLLEPFHISYCPSLSTWSKMGQGDGVQPARACVSCRPASAADGRVGGCSLQLLEDL